MNTGESDSVLEQAEARVLGIQTKLHRWARDDRHEKFDDRNRVLQAQRKCTARCLPDSVVTGVRPASAATASGES